MNKEVELIREQIETIQKYIDLLEKARHIFWGTRLSQAERTVMAAIDRRIGWQTQVLAILAGTVTALLALALGRFIARSPAIWLGVILTAGWLGAWTVVWIYHQSRKKIAEEEIQVAQLEIYRLQALMGD